MSHETAQAVIDELDQLLDRERQALLTGDLDQVARIVELKETLIRQINDLDAGEWADVAEVRSKLTRNQALLNSALEGIRAVADRMADLRRVRQSLETYDKSGRRTRHITQSGGQVERRA